MQPTVLSASPACCAYIGPFNLDMPFCRDPSRYKLDIQQFVFYLFGIDSRLNWFSWYVYFYIYAMILLPLIVKFIDYSPILYTTALSLISFTLMAAIHFLIPDAGQSMWWKAADSCLINTPTLLLGYILARMRVFNRWLVSISIRRQAIMAMVLASTLLIRCLSHYKGLGDWLFATIVIYCILYFFSIYRMPGIRKLLTAFGRCSTYMWFLHSLLFVVATDYGFKQIVFWPGNVCGVVLWFIVASYVIGFVAMKTFEIVPHLIKHFMMKIS